MHHKSNPHGGDITRACAIFGGTPEDWIDLSTGINRLSYPVPNLPSEVWNALPDQHLFENACSAARLAYQTDVDCMPTAGAQAAIQMIPRAFPVGSVSIVSPTYNEHASSFRAAGWDVYEGSALGSLPKSDACVVVNPNNPDGKTYSLDDLLVAASRHKLLIVDESFADLYEDQSAFSASRLPGALVLRSFGKFYGLAGLRLGFILGHEKLLSPLRQFAGPWSVSGPALSIGSTALKDKVWQKKTRERLRQDARLLDKLATKAGWNCAGGTNLFRLYDVPNASDAQRRLAKHKIWSRCFDHNSQRIRLGLPGTTREWAQLEKAFSGSEK